MSIWTSIYKTKKYRHVGKPRRWSREDDDLLKKWFGKKPIGALVKKLRRSKGAISIRARKKLGLKCARTWKLWLPEDDEYIKTWYGKKPIGEISAALNRTEGAIRIRAHHLNVHIYYQFGKR